MLICLVCGWKTQLQCVGVWATCKTRMRGKNKSIKLHNTQWELCKFVFKIPLTGVFHLIMVDHSECLHGVIDGLPLQQAGGTALTCQTPKDYWESAEELSWARFVEHWLLRLCCSQTRLWVFSHTWHVLMDVFQTSIKTSNTGQLIHTLLNVTELSHTAWNNHADQTAAHLVVLLTDISSEWSWNKRSRWFF